MIRIPDRSMQSRMKSRVKHLVVALFFGISATVLFACGPSASAPPNVSTINAASPLPTSDELAAGRDLFKQNCASCHRDSGTGGKITVDGKELDPKDLTSERMKGRSDEKLFRDIVEGAPDDGMPAFKHKLTESQIRETIRFIRRELQKLPIPAP